MVDDCPVRLRGVVDLELYVTYWNWHHHNALIIEKNTLFNLLATLEVAAVHVTCVISVKMQCIMDNPILAMAGNGVNIEKNCSTAIILVTSFLCKFITV